MKHIKICKPRNQESKSNPFAQDANSKNSKASNSKRGKSSPAISEGLGCVPSGNFIDQD